jgi:hypothetical protein
MPSDLISRRRLTDKNPQTRGLGFQFVQPEVSMLRRTVIVVGLLTAFFAGSWSAAAQNKKEPHPVLERAIEQITRIKDRLQGAPKDFGGHKQKAIEALSLANDELRQAIQFDKR